MDGISQAQYNAQIDAAGKGIDADLGAKAIREAVRRLDAMWQYATPPIDRNGERVSDWLRAGLEVDPEHRGNYEAAARTLLGER